MHIPSSMLQGTICPVTAAVATAGLATAGWFARRSVKHPTALRFAAVTALVFAGQMMNFPVQDGTSGHLVGGVLASLLLGVPFGVLSIAVVLAVQCLAFSDGGVAVLGANIVNMALVGAGLGGLIATWLRDRTGRIAGTAFASWFSIVLASLACSAELAWSGTAPFATVAPAMLGTHALIGLGETLITLAALALLVPSAEAPGARRPVLVPLAAAGLIALVLSPFASPYPDGLESVAALFPFLHASAPAFVAPMADYTFPGIASGFLSTGLAGLAGVGLVFAAAWLLARSGWGRRVAA